MIALDSHAHRHLRVNPTHGLAFGDGAGIVPVITAEFADLAVDTPILILRDGDSGGFFAAALLGFDTDENLHLEGAHWLSRHKPLDLQRRPFFVHVSDDGPELLIDLQSPRCGARGEPLFEADGTPSPYLEHIRAMMADILTGQAATRAFIEHLLDLNLLEGVSLTFDFSDAARVIDGVFAIRRAGLDDLGDADIVGLHRSGELELIHLMMAAFAHIPEMIRRKELRIGQTRSAATG